MESKRELIKCKFCSYTTRRKYNLNRHMKRNHNSIVMSRSAVDLKGEQSYNKEYERLNGEVCRRPQIRMDPERSSYTEKTHESNTSVCSSEVQSRKLSVGRPMSEEEYPHINPHERTMDLQDGGHYDDDDRYKSNPEDALYTPEQIEKDVTDMRRIKCHILDCIVDSFPEHLKLKANKLCDPIKCQDRIFITHSHEFIIDGKLDRGSNVRNYIMDKLTEPPTAGTFQFMQLEKENERLKRNLAYYEKALAKAKGLSRCRKFESIIDGTVDHCDFSDDTDSEEEPDTDEEETDTDEEDGSDKEDDSDGEESDEDASEDEYEEAEEEPRHSKAKKKKKY